MYVISYEGWALRRWTVEVILTATQIAEWQLGWVSVHAKIEVHALCGGVPEDYLFALALLEFKWKHLSDKFIYLTIS